MNKSDLLVNANVFTVFSTAHNRPHARFVLEKSGVSGGIAIDLPANLNGTSIFHNVEY